LASSSAKGETDLIDAILTSQYQDFWWFPYKDEEAFPGK